MSNPTNTPGKDKDVIYIDIDDEITAIIDKVRDSEARIVALVLPKRATVMQSIVNMRLLKRSAETAKKHIVLVTAEAGLLPLAGAVGLYVAKTPQSRPEIPPAPNGRPDDDDDEAVNMAAEPAIDRAKPIGAYAGAAAVGTGLGADAEAVELDDVPRPTNGQPGGVAPKGADKKDRKLMVPNFDKFRVLIIAGSAALVLLIIFGYLAIAVWPKATVLVKTDSQAVDTNLDVAFDTDADAVDTDDDVVPATLQQVAKTTSQTVDATGQLNKGEKASGQVTVTNCNFTPYSIPAGTGFSANGLTFISQKSVVIPKSSYDFSGGGSFKCNNDGKGSVDVMAQKAGASYNLESQSYTIANSPENVKATGSAMSGGTDSIVKIVSQADIDTAKSKIAAGQNDAIKLELADALDDKDYLAIDDTFKASDNPEVTSDVAVGAEASQVTVTSKMTYTMLGAKQNDLKKLIEAKVYEKIDRNKQTILDYGIDDAFFKVQTADAQNTVVTMQTTSVAGSDLDLEAIKKQVAGLKASEAKALITKSPGVTDVDVKYSPFWVKSIPKKTGKITITVQKPSVKNAD
jgi:hypothetical protein